MAKNLPANSGDVSLIPESGRFPGEGKANPLWYSSLGNPMDRRSLVDYIPWGCKRVSHDLRNKQQQQTQAHSNQEELLGEPGN